ncbi:MAG: InlB B-repeat-containing protein [Clostridia bacterium]|nr:InlB B-repeat-containing protein [Clostridia bacterium]
MKSAATCTLKSVYYYSCSCGRKGSETFEYGEALGHSFLDENYVYNYDATYDEDGTKTAKCLRCDETNTVVVPGTALKNVYTVEFVDYNGLVIDVQEVTAYGNVVAPKAPIRNGYKFKGWDKAFADVLGNITVKATYVKLYTVTFLDADKTVLERVDVEEGDTVEPSVLPGEKIRYDFIGWDFDLNQAITEDTVITASYRIKTFDVSFVMPDGTVIPYTYTDYSGDAPEEKTVETQKVEYGFSAFAPTCPDCYVDWKTMKAYSFTRWDNSFDDITENTVIKAVYESEYDLPVLAVEFSKNGNGDNTAALTIILPSVYLIHAVDLSIDYKPETGSISIESANVNSASPLWSQYEGEDINQYVINNKTKQFTFAWSDANGKSFTYSRVLSFIINLDGGAHLSGETFRVESKTVIVVSSDNGDTYKKITPYVVYRVAE